VIYQQCIAMYDSGCQIYPKWSRFKPGFSVSAHRSTMPHINMVPHPVTLNWHWANQPCSRPETVKVNQGSNRSQVFNLSFDPTGVRTTDLLASALSLHYILTLSRVCKWLYTKI